jgi:hypothetical protein
MSKYSACRVQQIQPNGELKLLAYVYLDGDPLDSSTGRYPKVSAWDEDGLPLPIPEYDTEIDWLTPDKKAVRRYYMSLPFRTGKVMIKVDPADKTVEACYSYQNRMGYFTKFEPVVEGWQPSVDFTARLHQLTLEATGKMISFPFRHPELMTNLTDSIASAQLVGVIDFEGGHWPIRPIGGWAENASSSAFTSKMNQRGGRIDINYQNMELRWDGDFAGCKFVVNIRMHNRNRS